MKLLLAQNASYYPALGGANKSNRTLMEALSRLGHECRVVSTALVNSASEQDQPGDGEIEVISSSPEVSVFQLKGVAVHAVKVRAAMDSARLKNYLIRQIEDFAPDRILISTEDVGHVLLEAAVNHAASKVVYLARTTLYLPFGPDCFIEAPDKTELLRKAAAIVVVGDYLKDYMWQWAKLKAEVLPISLFGDGPFPNYGNFEQGYVAMVNPCAYKGISIFLELARSFPELSFAAIPTWGTTSEDMKALLELKNVRIFDPVDDMNKLFCQTRVMLVPSLWAEAKSRTIVEAMLRGIPVLASDVGGNPEAKLGVEYVLPVNPIKGYKQAVDERSLPVSDIPEQPMQPWQEALGRLLSDRKHYEDVSRRSREAALDYVENRGGSRRVEAYLLNLQAASENRQQTVLVPAAKESTVAQMTDKLTPAQKALLALRLNKKNQSRGNDQ
ncbi:glycosyltransferase family 4 protein [Paenibacillus sp. KS-LC4]|uniref:glycosyltransferase family 4 protein n=1 Tax=Paenibacillus sp. KS-LC4 TaxID=2979727 RepID=UPI0030D12637